MRLRSWCLGCRAKQTPERTAHGVVTPGANIVRSITLVSSVLINRYCFVSPSQPIDNHHRVCTTDKPIREGQNGASDCSVCAELRSHPSKHPRRLHRSNSSAEQPVVTREQKSPKSLHVEVSLVVHLVQDLLSVYHGCVKYHRPLFLRRKRNFTAAETCRIENYGNRN